MSDGNEPAKEEMDEKTPMTEPAEATSENQEEQVEATDESIEESQEAPSEGVAPETDAKRNDVNVQDSETEGLESEEQLVEETTDEENGSSVSDEGAAAGKSLGENSEPPQTSEASPEDDANESDQMPQKETAETPQDQANAEAVASTNNKEHDVHPPWVIIVALLVTLLLVAVAFMAYKNSEEATTIEQLPSTNTAAGSETTTVPTQPATDADLQQSIKDAETVIDEINNLGAPADGLDDTSLGL